MHTKESLQGKSNYLARSETAMSKIARSETVMDFRAFQNKEEEANASALTQGDIFLMVKY